MDNDFVFGYDYEAANLKLSKDVTNHAPEMDYPVRTCTVCGGYSAGCDTDCTCPDLNSPLELIDLGRAFPENYNYAGDYVGDHPKLQDVTNHAPEMPVNNNT